MFHFGRKKTAIDKTESTPDPRQLLDEDADRHSTGLGISLNDYIDQLTEDLAPAIAEKVTLSGCSTFELVTLRMVPDRTFDASEEVEQHLAIQADGQIQFRSNTYHGGAGRLGIGRIKQARIPVAAVQEICRMLDTWLYTREAQVWTQPADCGKWYLRVRFDDGREQILRGAADGAYLMEMDISAFIRDRIPIDRLYLFDEDL